MSSLLTTDPQRRPTAEQVLLRLNEERNKVGGSPEPQYQKHKEEDDGDSNKTLVQSVNQHTPKDKMTTSKPRYWRPVQEDWDDDDDTLVQSKQKPTVKPNEKTTPIKPPMIESSVIASPLSTIRLKPASSDPPFLIISSSGPAADCQSDMFGLYKRTWERSEGRSVYIQEHSTEYGDNPGKLISVQGTWRIVSFSTVWLRAATPSESPTSVKWEYEADKNKATWREDAALTVTSFIERPNCECEVTISLSEDIKSNIMEPGASVAGLYRENGSYCRGRPVLQAGRFTLHVKYSKTQWDGVLSATGCWVVSSGATIGHKYLMSRTAPSQCPADPRAARLLGTTHWIYWNKQNTWSQSSGITVKCKTHSS